MSLLLSTTLPGSQRFASRIFSAALLRSSRRHCSTLVLPVNSQLCRRRRDSSNTKRYSSFFPPTSTLFTSSITTASRLSLTNRATMSAAATAPATVVATDDKFTRLPETAAPKHYKLSLKPDLVSFKCPGHVSIDLDVKKPTNVLELHASEIEINSVDVKLADGKLLKGVPFEVDRKWMTLKVKLPQKIDPQAVVLDIDFVADHNDKMRGFYRSSYKDKDGKEKFLVSTQFESTYARLSFPCWDEPVYKAKFDVTLEVDKDLTALSNMNVLSTVPSPTNPSKKVVTYATTPVMSSYLVAFAVGEFEYIEDHTKTGVPVRVYTVAGKKDLGKYALDLSTKALDYYNEFFDIKSPLPKVDLIAIPDFQMGAMENWGLVTYREVALLVDPKKSSTRQSMYVALVVAHELAHFWFGNLATMKWWDNLWLKEGFASFMEYLFVSKFCPEYEIWVHFVNDEWARGTSLDALRSSHPIEVPIDNPNELDEIYDSITYAKSNSIIRMLYTYLTEPVFQDGLRRYLKKFAYSNAVTADLWQAFSDASGQDVSKMMSTWTKQMGFPLVSVQQRVDGNKRVLSVSQQRFLADGGNDESNPLWHVPITVTTASSPNDVVFRGLLKNPKQEFVVEGVKPTDWLKVNAGTAGFYRVQYPEDMLTALLPAVADHSLPVLDRFGIAQDLYSLVEAGKAPASQFLSLLGACTNENEYVVWGALDAGVGSISDVLGRHTDTKLKAGLDKFVISVYEPLLARLLWEAEPNEPLKRSMLRALAVGRLSRAGHEPTIKVADLKFQEHVENGVELHPDLRQAIYGSVARNGDAKTIGQLRNIFETSGFSEIERNAIVALGQASNAELLAEIYDYGVTKGKIRAQDLISLFAGSRSSKHGQDFVWKYFQNNTPLLLEKFGGANSSLFQYTLKFAISGQADSSLAEAYEAYCKKTFDADQIKVLDRPIRQASEAVRLNARLLGAAAPSVEEFLGKAGI